MSRDRPQPPDFSPSVALVTLARLIEADVATALAPLGLTLRKYGMLGHIAGSPGVSFSELARRSRITVQSTHTAVGELVRSGLVADASARAGAASDLALTEAGRAALAEAKAAVGQVDRARFSGELAGGEQSRLADALFDAMVAIFRPSG